MASAKNQRDLFRIAMKGQWREVMKMYKEGEDAHRAKITRSGYTALHVAVSDGKEEVVEELIGVLLDDFHKAKEALAMQNEAGNTPLHIAASMGNVKMCEHIAYADPTLIGIQNEDGETPIFLAALHGKKDAFLCLHSFCLPDVGISYCRREDGDTILHCAIAGEYFELAFQIIHLYGDLVNYVNSEGLTPLHVLASKPSAFQSSSKLGRFKRMVYKCLFVNKLKRDNSYTHQPCPVKSSSKNEPSPSYPGNYRILVKFFQCVWRAVKAATNEKSAKEEIRTIENPATNEEPQSSVAPTQKENQSARLETQEHDFVPSNYETCFDFVKIVSKAILIVTGPGYGGVMRIRDEKEKHTWSRQILDELVERANMYDYEDPGETPWAHDDADHGLILEAINEGKKKSIAPQTSKKDSAMLIAAKYGITEIVEKILKNFPVAIHDINGKRKNIVLIAVESRQLEVYKLLLKTYPQNDGVFRRVDRWGNGALHFAARMTKHHKRWPIPGDALQMQWEIKWHKFVEKSMPPHFCVRYNRKGKTPDDIFTKTHKRLVVGGGQWMKSTAESCSVVAALIATVAFATSTALPGGINESSGKPTLEKQPAFEVFAISSLIALCFSVTSLVMFLAILTSRYQEKDFGTDLPWKLLLGLTSLFVSIASMLASFCAGHFFVLEDTLKYAAFPVYALIGIPVSFFAAAQFPLYFDLIRATFRSPFGDATKFSR
ncbi:hypothetical protein UlMin_013775 [Ulmus minor]